MIKYKVTFEITNRVGNSLINDKNLDKELFKEKLKEYHVGYKNYVKQMVIAGIEHQYDDLDKIKVTDFKIEEVVEND